MSRFLITGASGFLGHHLVSYLVDRGHNVVAVLGRPEDKANALPVSPLIEVYSCDALYSADFGHVDTLIHTAFSRGEDAAGLSASILMTRKVVEMVNQQDVDSMINISSQGVYAGLQPGQSVDENGLVAPGTRYGLAKWGVENMLAVGCRKKHTSIRMASLSSNARFLSLFVNSVKEGRNIKVTAPNQYASIMDVSDAVRGIVSIANLPLEERDMTYNLGPGVQYSILDYAESAIRIGREIYGLPEVGLEVVNEGTTFAVMMDCDLCKRKTGWIPLVDKDMMLTKMFY